MWRGSNSDLAVGPIKEAITPLGVALLKIIDVASLSEWGEGEQITAVDTILHLRKDHIEAEREERQRRLDVLHA